MKFQLPSLRLHSQRKNIKRRPAKTATRTLTWTEVEANNPRQADKNRDLLVFARQGIWPRNQFMCIANAKCVLKLRWPQMRI